MAGGMVAQGITVKFSANTSGLTDGAKQAQNVIGNFAKIGGVALLAVGAAAAAGGAAAVKMAGDFQAGITSLVTGAGESSKNIKMVSDGILDLATQTGTSTKQLTDGMYMIESAGYHGAAGLDVLKAAAEGAKVGNADLGTVANGVTTIMTDFASQNITASQATNTLVATVANGKTTMQALSSSLASILPTASAAHVGLTDVMSAMATMTGEGVPAAQAATYLRQTITALSAPSKQTMTALKGIGLSADQVASQLKESLPNTLHTIMEALGKKFPEGSLAYNEALKNIAGGSKQLQGVLDLTGSHFNTFALNFDAVDNAVTGTGNKITGFAQVQQSFNFKMDQAKEVVETLGIKLGTKLLPLVADLVSKILPAITSFGDWLIKSGALENTFNMLVGAVSGVINVVSTVVGFFQRNQAALEALKGVMLVAAGVIGGALVFSFVAWAAAAWAAAIATIAATWPFLLVGAVIGAVVFGIIEAVQHWGAITKWFQGVWGAMSSWFMGIVKVVGTFFVGVWQGIAGFFTGIWNGIISGLKAAWAFIVAVVKAGAELVLNAVLAPFIAIGELFIWLYNHNYYFKALVDFIVNAFKIGFAWLTEQWQRFTGWLGGVWQGTVSLASSVWGAVSGAIKTAFSASIGFVSWIWGVISSFFVNAWNNYISKPLTSLWQNVSNFFSGVWSNYIAGPIGDLWNTLSTTVGGWATSALDWGKNVINGFINGIKNAASGVGNALSGVGDTIKNFLGFHSPTKEGPGREADIWAPNFVKMYAKGITDGLPQIQNAVNKLSTPLALSMSNNFKYPTPSASNNAAIAASAQPVIVQSPDIYVDGYKLTERLGPHIANKIRLEQQVRRH